MPNTPDNQPITPRPLRLWPGVAIAAVLLLVRFVIPFLAPTAEIFGMDTAMLSIFGAMICLVATLVWWLFFSRARWSERFGVLAVMVLAIVAIRPLTHISIQNGMMSLMFFVYSVPATLPLAFVAGLLASRRMTGAARWAVLAAAIVIGCGAWTLVRTNGLFGGAADLAWRWTPTAEERLLAQSAQQPLPVVPSTAPAPAEAPKDAPKETAEPVAAAPPSREAPATAPPEKAVERPVKASAELVPAEWPGFRGPHRDDVIPGVKIETDWTASPPVAIWRHPVGPGWSSFAVAGNRLYTQEQRGEHEIVACYDTTTGKPVWMHRDPVRFWESNGGAGPRATPTLSNGRVYTLGATGILNALDAERGTVAWSRNAANDTGVTVPGWGFSASPVVVDDVVVVATSGALAGYDVATGAPRWTRKSDAGSYSSPHLATIDGVPQVLLMAGNGLTSVTPGDGTLLWEHAWQGVPIVQPAQIGGGDFLITTADAMGGLGMRRISVTRRPGQDPGWTVEERWTSRGLKPYFNDYVVHGGYAFGFDGNILSCIDLATGERKWKGGRYGNGQLVLLSEQDLMIVLSEDGELALVGATPDKFTELARLPALEGKTWNHHVLVGDTLLVRNGEEMAAYRLVLAGR